MQKAIVFTASFSIRPSGNSSAAIVYPEIGNINEHFTFET